MMRNAFFYSSTYLHSLENLGHRTCPNRVSASCRTKSYYTKTNHNNMKALFSVLAGLCPVFVLSCLPSSFNVIDLSHTLDKDSLKWPTGSDFTLTILSRGWQGNKKFWYEMNKFDTPEHISTHLDAPSHFSENAWRLHEIPADRLVGPGIVIDVRDQVSTNDDYRLQVSDLENWETFHGAIPKGAIVLMWSGWDSRYPQKTLTFNTDTPDDVSTFHFPGFHPDAATWLVNNRHIRMIGVDTPSTDYGQSKDFEVHRIISNAYVMGLENVNNLGQLPAAGFMVVAAPIKMYDGSGVPVRLLALVDNDGEGFCETGSGRQSCYRP
ncbi:hypothetical protein Btru_055996 [Bulinus truncatus]|nr:hypothetical protein Btru_055996 [Bulinus truncatus]